MTSQAIEEELRLLLAATPTAPSRAREFTRAALRTRHVPPDEVRATEIVVSELATNAYRASGTTLEGIPEPKADGAKSENIGLTLRLLPGEVVVEVTDDNPALPVPANVEPDSESGRGLLLVDAFSKAWGHSPSASGGKIVYAILGITRPPPGARAPKTTSGGDAEPDSRGRGQLMSDLAGRTCDSAQVHGTASPASPVPARPARAGAAS